MSPKAFGSRRTKIGKEQNRKYDAHDKLADTTSVDQKIQERKQKAEGRVVEPKIDVSNLDLDSRGRVIERQTPSFKEGRR